MPAKYLNEKQSKFCKLYLERGMVNAHRAYIDAGFRDTKSSHIIAYRLTQHPLIKKEAEKVLEARRLDTTALADMNRDWLITKIEELRTLAISLNDLSTAARCLELHGRVMGIVGGDGSININQTKVEVLTEEKRLEAKRLASIMVREGLGMSADDHYKPEDGLEGEAAAREAGAKDVHGEEEQGPSSREAVSDEG